MANRVTHRAPVAERDLEPRRTPDASERTSMVIEPSTGWSSIRLRELWRARELVYFLAWRDVKVRYKQTIFGAGWAVIQPTLSMIVFAAIFGRIAHLPSEGMPYAIFTLVALLPWTYFAYVLQQAGNSLVANPGLISKVYFPRLALPLAVALAALVDLLIASSILAILMLAYHVQPAWQIVFLPFFLLLTIATSLGFAIWFAALNVQYRDVKYVLPFLTQIWLYLSPVAYSSHLVKGKLGVIYAANPMVGVVDGFRWSILGVGGPPGFSLLSTIVVVGIVTTSGVFYFRRMEHRFADVI